MCDLHGNRELDHYCTEHEEIMCSQCATEGHTKTPCQSMPLVGASKQVADQLEEGMFELKKLKSASQSILGGRRLDDMMRMVQEVEDMVDSYFVEIKRKIDNAKSLLKPFSVLSREEMWKLKTIATKKLPTAPPVRTSTDDQDVARDLVARLQEVRKQTKAAKDVLNTLPNYVEVSIGPGFMESLSFEGNPIVITQKGQTILTDDDFHGSVSSASGPQETVQLIEKSHFRLEHCTDIAILEDCIIASVGDSVQKRDRKSMSFRQAMAIPDAGKLCVIGETTEVSVLQKTGYITIFDTFPNLKPLYRLLTDAVYHDMCYLESMQGDTGCPKQSPVFVVCYTNRDIFSSDCIDLISAKRTKYPGKLPSFHVKSTTVAESSFGKDKSRFVGTRSISAYQGRFIVAGAKSGVTCINKAGFLIWMVNTTKHIYCMLTYKTLIFVYAKDERKIMIIGKQGQVVEENVLPPVDICPQKLSADKDMLMVKYGGKYEWIIFQKKYENVRS